MGAYFMMYQNTPDAPVFTRHSNLNKSLFYTKIKENYRYAQRLFNKNEYEKHKLLYQNSSHLGRMSILLHLIVNCISIIIKINQSIFNNFFN